MDFIFLDRNLALEAVRITEAAALSSSLHMGRGNEKAADLGITVKFKIRSRSVAGVDWTRMGSGPLPATEKALKKADLTMDDIETIELNEAFAALSLYVIRKGNWDMD